MNLGRTPPEQTTSERLHDERDRLLEMVPSGEVCLAALCAAVPHLDSTARARVLITEHSGSQVRTAIAPDLDSSFAHPIEIVPTDDQALGTCGGLVLCAKIDH